MHGHNLKPADFVDLDCKYGVLCFIENCYEPFRLTITQGVINEVNNHIRIQRKHTKVRRS